MTSSMKVIASGVLACGRRQEPCSSFRSVSWDGRQDKAGQHAVGVAERQVRLDEQLLVLLHAGDGGQQAERGECLRRAAVRGDGQVVGVDLAGQEGWRLFTQNDERESDMQVLADAQGEGRGLSERSARGVRRFEALPDVEPDRSRLLQRDPYGGQPGLDAPDDGPRQDQRPITYFHSAPETKLGQSNCQVGKCTKTVHP